MIAEAKKAAKILEVAASKSSTAQASLIETRKLIAEAIQSLESIDRQHIAESNDNDSSMALEEVDEDKGTTFEVCNWSDMRPINGHNARLPSFEYEDIHRFPLQKLPNGANGCFSTPLCFDNYISKKGLVINSQADTSPSMEEIQPLRDDTPSRSPTMTKKWVRGRLVDVQESE